MECLDCRSGFGAFDVGVFEEPDGDEKVEDQGYWEGDF